MRQIWDVDIGLYRFCHVCRYLLVDKIDPTRHALLDAEYSKVYPER
jgi:hypothetical protein